MEGAYNIPDPTDWLETPLKDFSPLENALHCDICKEFYDTPMITSCCHTFCSKCIRTCLSANGKCPSCQAADQASKLRNNWQLQTIVEQFLVARPAALEVARRGKDVAEQAKRPGKRKRIVMDSDDAPQGQDVRTTRSKSRRIAFSQNSQPEPIEIDDSGSEYEPEKPPEDGKVECLFGCGKRVKPEEMDAHLDRCNGEPEEKQQASRAKSRTPVSSLGARPSPSRDRPLPDRISELNYSLLTDAKLRQKLKDAGIPNWGAKQLMIKRHTEWVNMWNANCDSGGRKTQRELLRDLDAWERTQGGRAPNVAGLSSTIMRKDFDGQGWASSNKQDFSRLIADAKRRKNNPATAEERPKDADASNEAATAKPDVVTLSDSSNVEDHGQKTNHEAEAPYENNPEAIASIREKVQAANEGRHIEPHINADFEGSASRENLDRSNSTASGPAHGDNTADDGSGNEAMLEQARLAKADPSHHNDPRIDGQHMSPSKDDVVKVPMFAVPQRPVSDIDGAETGK